MSRLTTARDVDSYHFAVKRVYEDEDKNEVVDCDLCGDTYFSKKVDQSTLGLPFWYCNDCVGKLDFRDPS